MGETFAVGIVSGGFGDSAPNLFILFWLMGWTAGGFFFFKILLWTLIGKEIITVGHGQLIINKKGSLFFRSKTYDLMK